MDSTGILPTATPVRHHPRDLEIRSRCGPQAKREAVKVLMTEHRFGVTRACGLASISRSLYRYVSRRGDASPLKQRIGDIAAQLGVHKTALYHYFPDKQTILHECHREASAELKRLLVGHLDAGLRSLQTRGGIRAGRVGRLDQGFGVLVDPGNQFLVLGVHCRWHRTSLVLGQDRRIGISGKSFGEAAVLKKADTVQNVDANNPTAQKTTEQFILPAWLGLSAAVTIPAFIVGAFALLIALVVALGGNSGNPP